MKRRAFSVAIALLLLLNVSAGALPTNAFASATVLVGEDWKPGDFPDNMLENATIGTANQNLVTVTKKDGELTLEKVGEESDSNWSVLGAHIASTATTYTVEKKYAVSLQVKNGATAVASSVSFAAGIGAYKETEVVTQTVSLADWSDYKHVITAKEPPVGWGMDEPRLLLGFSEAASVPTGAKAVVNWETAYVAEEELYDITNTVTSGSQKIPSGIGGTLALEAALVNQIGTRGTLEQGTFTWLALNETRDTIVSGITVTPSADTKTATVTVAASVPMGTYRLAVKSDLHEEYIKTVRIEVFAPTDHVPKPNEIPSNMVTGYEYTGGGVTTKSNVGNCLGLVRDTGGDVGSNGVANSWNPIGYKVGKGAFEAGSDYVVSLQVKNGDLSASESVLFAAGITDWGFGTNYSNQSFKEQAVNGSEWISFKEVIPCIKQGTDIGLVFGFSRRERANGATILINKAGNAAPYVAKEIPYDVKNILISGKENAHPGDVLKFRAEVVNQIDVKGTLDQSFRWYVFNENKTAIAEAISLEVGTDTKTATVTVGDSAAAGTYHVVAVSNEYENFVKTKSFSVAPQEDYIPAEKPANMIRYPTDANKYIYTGGRVDIKRNTYTEVERDTIDFSFNSTTETAWNPGGLSLNSEGLTEGFKKNTRYVVSARVKNLAPDTVQTVTFAAGIGLYTTTCAEQSISGNEWSDFKQVIALGENADTTQLQLGFPRSETNQAAQIALDLDEGCEPYVAEEVLYDITNTVNSGSPVLKQGVGGEIIARAAIVNQIGLPGEFRQEFSWKACSAEKTQAVQGITVVPNLNTDTATVRVDSTVEAGAYRIVAKSSVYDDMSKTLWIYVTDNAEEMNIYVSPNGNDGNPGMLSSPLKTLEAAQKAVRCFAASGVSCTVILRGGDYRVSKPLLFSAEDSGEENASVVWKGYGKETPVIKGSVVLNIDDARPVTDTEILERIHPNAKGRILEIDLAASGIAQEDIFDPAVNTFNNQDMLSCGEYNSLYINGTEQELAHWPNGNRYANFAEWVDADLERWPESWEEETNPPNPESGGSTPKTFRYQETDTAPSRWTQAENWWVTAYAGADFSRLRMSAASVNPENNTVTLKNNVLKQEAWGFFFSKRWQAWNLLEEIDVPGEFYIDRENMKLYFYPPEDVEDGKLELSLLGKPLVKLRDASDITFQNMEFTQTRHHAVEMIDVKNIDFEACRFRYVSGDGIFATGSKWAVTQSDWGGTKTGHWQQGMLDGSYNVDIKNSEFYMIGGAAVDISGGNVDTLTPSGNVIENNVFYKASQRRSWLADTVTLRGVGTKVKNNEFGATPGQVMRLWGNDHLIEYNEVYDVMQEVTDAGAIYRGGNEIGRGDVVQYNYFHDFEITDTFHETAGGSTNKVWRTAIYWDGSQQGGTAKHNIFYHIPQDLMCNAASAIEHSYNTSVDITRPIRYTKGGGTQKSFAQGTAEQAVDTILNKELYFEHYPALKAWAEGTNALTYTTLKENLLVGCAQETDISEDTKENATIEKLVEVESCDDFVDNFRIKSGSATAQNMPNLLNDAFEMSSIGLQRKLNLGQESSPFRLLYPQSGQGIEPAADVEFVWEQAFGASKYRLVIADNPELDNPVVDVTSEFYTQTVAADKFAPNQEYYWQVFASNPSFQNGNEWINIGGLSTFTTGITVRDFAVTAVDGGYHVTAQIRNAGASCESDCDVYLAFYNSETELSKLVSFSKPKEENLTIDETVSLSGEKIQFVCLFVWDGELKPKLSKSKYTISFQS